MRGDKKTDWNCKRDELIRWIYIDAKSFEWWDHLFYMGIVLNQPKLRCDLYILEHLESQRKTQNPVKKHKMIICESLWGYITMSERVWVISFTSNKHVLVGLVGLDLFNDDTRPSGHISRPTQVNVSQSCFHSLNNYSSLIILYTSGGWLKLINYIISDRKILLLAGILLCKSQELSRREHSMSRLCSIHHDIPLTMHTPAACGQWSVFDHNGDNQLVVLGTRCGIWWPWYGRFKVGWLQPLQLWLGAGTSSVAPVLVSRDRDLYHVQLHPTWFVPISECRSLPGASYLYSGHLPVGLYLGRGSLLLVDPLFHFRQCHSGLVPSRNQYGCPCHSVTRAGSWYGK